MSGTSELLTSTIVDPRMGESEPPATSRRLRVALISLHGLIRAKSPELGCDADTGGQVKYVLELAEALGRLERVAEVELLTRQIVDPTLSEDYARLEEPISERARIIRIPFGPRRYLRKESLWPYIELFVDQALSHFRRVGLPDVIHAHYADAGLAGAQLAQLLQIPFVFTGHSLGRVKRARLMNRRGDAESLERRYRFSQRIEAEETSLETASMIVASTRQEVESQYRMYDHYVPSRMEVIPPGVDLSRFSPPDGSEATAPIRGELERFLVEPSKPMILAMARPDDRKNLEALVRVYGESRRLQEAANLVLILGTRDNLVSAPPAARKVLKKLLYLIDLYDLYGKVAYPKRHQADDVPDLYRLAAASRGVFVNPALTEPFGLTLLEAGASGLPIVATEDGGPADIVANCRHGLLIDPHDDEAIERAIHRVLDDPQRWEAWSRSGIDGTRAHYSWQRHVERYLRNVDDILRRMPAPSLAHGSPTRRLPEFDRLMIVDLDETLTGDDAALAELIRTLQAHDWIGFGLATGRRLDDALDEIQRLGLPRPDLIASDAGTQLHYGKSLTPDVSWRKAIGFAWKPDAVRELLDQIPGLHRQEERHQSQFKISYVVEPGGPSSAAIRKRLREAGVRAKVILSLGVYLDVIPVRGGADMTMRHLLWKWGISPERVLVAGDSGNDVGMMLGRTLGVVVGNHGPEMERLRRRPRVYFAKAHHAAGVLEGIQHYQFLGDIVIPEDSHE